MAVKYNALEKLNDYREHGVDDHYTESYDGKKYLDVKFQVGGSATTEKNGAFIEDLLIVAYAKLNEYNQGLPSRENSLALTKIEEAILWLTARKAVADNDFSAFKKMMAPQVDAEALWTRLRKRIDTSVSKKRTKR